jgi:hypothetical protein
MLLVLLVGSSGAPTPRSAVHDELLDCCDSGDPFLGKGELSLGT